MKTCGKDPFFLIGEAKQLHKSERTDQGLREAHGMHSVQLHGRICLLAVNQAVAEAQSPHLEYMYLPCPAKSQRGLG